VAVIEMDELDLDNRRLCPDGTCVGVLDDTGRCPVCGAMGEAAPVSKGPANGANGVNGVHHEPVVQVRATDDSDHDSDDDRQLCPDDNCIGLIGADGRCKVCHTAAT